MIIIGAGLAGCIAATINQNAMILEANAPPLIGHQALLRFKTDVVSKITGIPFKKVIAMKAIWYDGKEVNPSPRFTAMYSNKVANNYSHRSVMNIDSEERYVAPRNFHQILLNQFEERIQYGFKVDAINNDVIRGHGTDGEDKIQNRQDKTIISTMPISHNAVAVGYSIDTSHKYNAIYVNKFIIKDCDMYCTVYFPGGDTSIYRASITGDVLIIESLHNLEGEGVTHDIQVALGVEYQYGHHEHIIKNHKQILGKISKIDEDRRQHIIYNLTVNYDIYSLGRFALWKNILLDDVVQDVYKIKELINKSNYHKLKEMQI